MKITFTLSLLFITTLFYSQDCGPITASSKFVHDNLQFNILNGDEALNELLYKVGIGPDGAMSTREYTPIVYSSNVWAGGEDPNGAVKLAVGSYNESDWTSGPVDEDGQTNDEICVQWDQVFTVTKEDIMKARKIYLENGPCDEIPASVINWPARGNPFLPNTLEYGRLADWWDTDMDAKYNPCNGDLPSVTLRSQEPYTIEQYFSALPSQISFYMMNSAGKSGMVTGSENAQLQVSVYLFSYKMQELRDVIFIKYSLKNYSPDDARNFHFGNWFDFDLGCSENDFIGTDAERNMVYVYNSNQEEECITSGSPLPNSLFGVSYLGGMNEPYLIQNIGGKDSLVIPPLGSGTQDTLVRTKMKTSVVPVDCINPSMSNTCKPQDAIEYYNILLGLNTDGSPILDNNGNKSKKMFTGSPNESNEWSMCNDDKIPLTSAITSVSTGLHQPGANNEVLLALMHARDGQNAGCSSIAALQHKQQLVEDLYNSKFFHFVGPPPPIIDLSQSSEEMTLSISELPTEYTEHIPEAAGFPEEKYLFEGIQIYQVKSPDFDLSELDNSTVSRLFYQGDIQNGVTEIYNWETYFSNGVKSLFPERKVDGSDIGIAEEILFDRDLFDNTPVEAGKTYYFVALSYAHNNYEQYDPITQVGQKYGYLASTCGVKVLNSTMLLSNTDVESKRPYNFQNYGQKWSLENGDGPLKVSLLTSNGQRIMDWGVEAGLSLDSELISDLPPGIYFLKVLSKKMKKLYAHKVITLE